MQERHPYLLVGGGFAGLLTAKLLQDRAHAFVGLEKTDAFGGSAGNGHQRFYDEKALEFLREKLGELEWTAVEEPPRERRKGEWRGIEENLSDAEKFFLRAPFFNPRARFAEIVQRLTAEVGRHFHKRKQVDAIHPEGRRVVCADGSEFHYETLVWCADIEALLKAWQGDKAALLKSLKPLQELPGGLDWEIELKEPVIPAANTVVFPFRYKETKLRALGVPEASNLHWLLFLEDEIADDREEIAKCVRALKREILKEFPDLKEKTQSERIVYLTEIVTGNPAPVKSLNVLPDVLYIGPQVRLPESGEELQNLDRIIDNCRRFEATLTQTQE